MNNITELIKSIGKKGMTTEGVLVTLGIVIALTIVVIVMLSDSSSTIKTLIRSIFG